MTNVQDQWSSAKPLLGALPNWIADEQEKKRVGAYALYEAIYWCMPEAFKLVSRGQENNPIYVPAGRSIVETVNRFLCPGLQVVADPAFGNDNEKLLATQVWTDFTRRERFYGKFNSNKRYGVMRGDWFFHLYADPEREPGTMISIFGIDPASVFPIYNPLNVDEIIGYHILDQVLNNENKVIAKRLTYLKETMKGGPSPILVSEAYYELDKWGGPGMDPEDPPLEIIRPPTLLPEPINALPIYHIQNFEEPGTIWGSSEMRGLERLLAGISQGISDEDLALALDGLGVYATDAGTPVNDDGEEVPWNLGPARVVELPDGKKMMRVTGVASVEPSQAHLEYLHRVLDEAVGISPVAKGAVQVSNAESGIALYLELAPLLAHVGDKQQTVEDVVTQMLFDLPKWYVAYEGGAFRSLMDVTRWIPTFDSPIPQDRAGDVKELLSIAANTPQVISMAYVRMRLRMLGYDDLPDDATMMTQIALEQTSAAMASQDAFGARVDGEVQGELQNDLTAE